jgi:hypothetical protein
VRDACPVPATGSQSASAATASTSHSPRASRQPTPSAAPSGTVRAAPRAAPTLSDAEYAPMTGPGWANSRFTYAGSSTLARAMAAPASRLPA